MGFTWFAVDDAVADHPKVMDLEARLDDANAVAYVLRLWCWTHRYAPEGRIGEHIVLQLERAVRWNGAPRTLIQTMLDVGLLDAVSGGVEVHDWAEHQGALVEKSKRDAALKRKKRRSNGAKTARAGRSNGAQTAPAPTYLQDQQDMTDKTDHLQQLAEAYRQVRGAPYAPTKADQGHVVALLAKARDLAEVEARWRVALGKSRDKFHSPKVHDLGALVKHWNAFPVAVAS